MKLTALTETSGLECEKQAAGHLLPRLTRPSQRLKDIEIRVAVWPDYFETPWGRELRAMREEDPPIV